MRERLADLLFHWLAGRSLRTLHRLGEALGWLLFTLPTDARRTTDDNLQRCLPELTPAQRAHLARRSLAESAKAVLEMGLLWTLPRERFEALIREQIGTEDLRAELTSGRGVIIASPHLGAWEVCGLYCSMLSPMTSLYRAPKIASLGKWARRGRERFGAQLVPIDTGGVRALLSTLKHHHLVGILPDQDAGRDGSVFAPFFGVPASTMTLLSRLAHKTGCAVFLICAERLPRGDGFRIHCRRADSAVSDASLETAVATLNREVEALIRIVPEQYLWSYKRFKTAPPLQ